jgi:hypothetical protein
VPVAGTVKSSGRPRARPSRLVVADKNIRREGVECAGALPFQFVHAEAPFRVEATDGEVVAEGELPAERSRNAEPEIDWEVDRIPTFCVLDFEVDVPEPGASIGWSSGWFAASGGISAEAVAASEPVSTTATNAAAAPAPDRCFLQVVCSPLV